MGPKRARPGGTASRRVERPYASRHGRSPPEGEASMYSDPRPCRREELPALARLTNRVFRPSGGDMAAEYPLVFQEENREQLRVIDRDGELVSHVGICLREALILGIPLRVASIGAVCTDPTCRGAGLASRLMEDVRAHA